MDRPEARVLRGVGEGPLAGGEGLRGRGAVRSGEERSDKRSVTRARLPWFRAHAALAADPGRLLAAHCAHAGLLAGWAAGVLAYEALLSDPSDPALGPGWRQGALAGPAGARLGLSSSAPAAPAARALDLEDGAAAHAAPAGLLVAAAAWHWAFWDLDLFLLPGRALALHLARLFGAHLALGGAACFGFGGAHLAAAPGFWTTDSLGSLGAARPLLPAPAGLLAYGSLAAHHLAAGAALAAAGAWHGAALPGAALWRAAAGGSAEGVLASGLAAAAAAALSNAALAWYGGAAAPADLFGATRFSWDSCFHAQELGARARVRGWLAAPEGLLLPDYIGAAPAKGGLFRAGPAALGDGVPQAWDGHAGFGGGGRALAARRMPAFFEAFPVLLADERGLPRAAAPFRRAESSKYAPPSGAVSASLAGGTFGETAPRAAPAVKAFARKAQLGEVLSFGAARADGVFRAAARGWFTYSHAALAAPGALGHLWHAGRALFRDTWAGARPAGISLEYGARERLAGARG